MTRRSATRPEVRVGGWWLSSIVPNGWGELVHSTQKRGSWQATWAITVDHRYGHWRHPALVNGALVDVHLGPVRVWAGTLDEPDWDDGVFRAHGAPADGDGVIAFDFDGKATTKPNTALDAAIARGAVPWTRAADFGDIPVGKPDDEGSLVTLTSVLDAWAAQDGRDWAIDEQRRVVIIEPDETHVDWLVVPGSGVLGSSAEDRADKVFVRYQTTTGRLDTAEWPAGPVQGIERPVDVTDRGPMTEAEATEIAKSTWAELAGRSGWTNGLTLAPGQVTTPGGGVADLAIIRSGQTTRALGVPDPRGVAQNLDTVIGDTEYNWEDDELQANPVGLAARDEDSILDSVTELAASAMAKADAASADAATAGPKVATGSETASLAGAPNGGLAVSFPAGRFTAAPHVVATTTNNLYHASVSSVTANGCNVTVRHTLNTNVTANINVYWVAVQT